MKRNKPTKPPVTINELISGEYGDFYTWQSERIVGYGKTADRFSRIHDAAEHGCDGSTYAEKIDDFRDFADEVYGEYFDTFNNEADEVARKMLDANIDRCERWHIDNGSIDQQVG